MCRKAKDLRTELEKKAKEIYFTMSDGVQVRVLEFNLAKKPNPYKILLIPGFLTVFQSWYEVLNELTTDSHIYYFESREKASSIFPNKKIERQVDLDAMAHDIKEVVEQIKLDKQKYITLCSSTGGTIEIIALANKWLNPRGAVMVGPTVEYGTIKIAAFFVSLVPEIFKKIIFMPFFRLFLRLKYVNKKAEPEQYKKYVRAAEEAKKRRIAHLIWQTTYYQCWDLLPKVDVKTILIGASADKTHATKMTIKTHELIPNSTYVDLGSNKATHSKPLVDTLRKFVSDLKK